MKGVEYKILKRLKCIPGEISMAYNENCDTGKGNC